MYTDDLKDLGVPSVPYSAVENKMIEAWGGTLQALDRYTTKLIQDCFFSVRVKVMVKILHHLSEENRLSRYDEKIFEYFQHLLWHYYETIHLYEECKGTITHGKIKEILDGVCTVLASQLRQFEESQQQEYIGLDPRGTANPVKQEKERFITETKTKVLELLNEMERQFMEDAGAVCAKIVRENVYARMEHQHQAYIENLREIYKQLIEKKGNGLYSCYVNTTKYGIEKINNLHIRKAAHFYYESIQQEKENLEIIIKVQVKALETELNAASMEPEEEQKIQQILGTLKEAYQHLGKEIEELEKFFKEAENQEKKIRLFSEEEFFAYLYQEGMEKYIQDWSTKLFPSDVEELVIQWNEVWEYFLQSLQVYIQGFLPILLEELQGESLLDQVQEGLTSNKLLADSMIRLFDGFKEYFRIREGVLTETAYKEILHGIQETMEIKIENLKENTQIFYESIDELLHGENPVKACIYPEDLEKIQELFVSYWQEHTLEAYKQQYEIELLGPCIQEAWNSITMKETMQQILKKMERKNQQMQEILKKKQGQFLREHLLFEMTTYEEILHYSISRLKEEQEDAEIHQYVAFVDQLTADLEKLLIDHEIDLIRPKPHESFNGREHEVLMAEKQEGFSKGEIIKVTNTGYRYMDQVIIRANVIAAK